MNINLAPTTETHIDPSVLRRAAGRFVTGVSVVTAENGAGKPHGATVNAITCLSLNPPLYLICLSNTSATLEAIQQTHAFGINILSNEQNTHAIIFASKDADKFESVGVKRSTLGVPLLQDTVATVECEVESLHPGGDHTIVVGCVKSVHECDKIPLVVRSGQFVSLSEAI